MTSEIRVDPGRGEEAAQLSSVQGPFIALDDDELGCRVSSVLLCPTLSYYFMLVLLCPTFLQSVLLCPTFWDFSVGLVKSWAEVGLLK